MISLKQLRYFEAVARVRHFGNWLRIAADLPSGAELTVLVTIHVKA